MILATIVESIPNLVAIADGNGSLLYLNAAGRRLVGLGEDAELTKLDLAALHAPDSREPFRAALQRAQGGERVSTETVLLGANGTPVPCAEQIVWHESPDPAATYFAFTAHDLTEQKLSASRQSRDDAFKSQAEEIAHLGYWVWEIVRNRVTWSPELFRIYGLQPGEFAASFEGYLSRLHPQDHARVRESIEHALRDRRPFTFDERIVRPSGEIRHLRSWGSVTTDPEGQPVEMFGTCLDTTELVETTENLRRTEEWLSTALGNTRVAVWEWNVQTNLMRLFGDAVDVLGLPGESLGTFDDYLAHVHPADRGELRTALRECTEDGKDLDQEHRFLPVGGSERCVVARARLGRDASGRAERLIGTLVDVTHRRRDEEERRQLLEQLARARRLEAVGRLAAGVAHDFNNHLTIIQGSAEHLALSAGFGESAREPLQNIHEAVKSAASLTSELLAFSRDQQRSTRIESIDLNDVVRDAAKFLRRLLPENVGLELTLSEPLPKIRCDREQIDRVLLNLVVNARDAMPEGGRITLRTERREAEAVLEVRDTGAGMTPEVMARIFEPFFTTKRSHGTGLGLATVFGIVSQNGGTIAVESEVGRGTCFTLRLPLAGVA